MTGELSEPPAPPRHLTPADIVDVVPGLDVSGSELRVGDLAEVLGRPLLSGTVRVAVLDGIDDAWERAQLGRQQAAAGDTVALHDL